VPDEAGVEGAKLQARLLSSPSPSSSSSTLSNLSLPISEAGPLSRSIVLSLVSGGASALMPYPAEPVTLGMMQETTKLLLASGASIDEVNAVRKHLEVLKGGQLARLAIKKGKALALSALVISDVVGDPLATIASGLTVPDDSTFPQVVSICEKYGISERLPPLVWKRLQQGARGEVEETPKASEVTVFDHCSTLLVGSAATAAKFVESKLRQRYPGAYVHCFSNRFDGEAAVVGQTLADKISSLLSAAEKDSPSSHMFAFVATGELTVRIRGHGKGGRNQELLLSMLLSLQDSKQLRITSLRDRFIPFH